MAQQAESVGVEIFPGFAAAEVRYRAAPKAGGGPNHAAM
jgi:flavin-dependent dehydrogenase